MKLQRNSKTLIFALGIIIGFLIVSFFLRIDNSEMPEDSIGSDVLDNSLSSENSCKADSDCACGKHIETGECFFGNAEYVDVLQQCPDFCTGIAGHLKVSCVENVCRQSSSLGRINDFDECIAAGNPAMESYPRQCMADGRTFVEEINQ